MKPQLNHLIVWAKDRRAADFADANGNPRGLHLAFLVTERQFDEIFGRIMDKALPYLGRPSPDTTGSNRPSRRRTRCLLQ